MGESFAPYFALAYAFLTLEIFLKSRQCEKWYVTYKSHLLMIYSELVAGAKPNRKDHKQADTYAKKILSNAIDNNKFESSIQEAMSILNECKKIWVERCRQSPYAMKDVHNFTTLLIKKVRNEYFEWFVKKLSNSNKIDVSYKQKKRMKKM